MMKRALQTTALCSWAAWRTDTSAFWARSLALCVFDSISCATVMQGGGGETARASYVEDGTLADDHVFQIVEYVGQVLRVLHDLVHRRMRVLDIRNGTFQSRAPAQPR